MTLQPPNADELVSAYLDGEAAPDEVALVEASPELLERVEALRGVASRVGAPVAPPPEQREAHIAAALAEFDLLGAADAPPLAAVPSDTSDAPELATDTTNSDATDSEATDSGVRSLAAARDRKIKRRRFSPGIIAAAAAAVLLFVGLAALSIGRGDDDSFSVADEAPVSAESGAAEAADESVESFDLPIEDEEDAMAMRDSSAAQRAGNALSEVEAATDDEEAMADEEEAMADDEAMEDNEEAMADEEEAVGDVDSDSDAAEEAGEPPASAATSPPQPADFFLGDFETQAELDRQLQRLSPGDLDTRLRSNGGAGLFPNCQAEIPELAGEVSTLIGEAMVADQAVEIHLVPTDTERPDDQTVIIVDPLSCTVASTIDY